MVQVAASLAAFLDFVKVGTQSNWWGLACPAHCGSPAFVSLATCFIAGLGFGFSIALSLTFFLLARFYFFSGPLVEEEANPGPAAAVSRLSGYLHARQRRVRAG